MPKKKAPPPVYVKWTPLQVKVAEKLGQNVAPQEIAKQVGCTESLITKVKHAMANPDNPIPTVEFTPGGTPGMGPVPTQTQQNVLLQFGNQNEDEVPDGVGDLEENPPGDQIPPPGNQTPPPSDQKTTPDKVAKNKSEFTKKQPDVGLTTQIQIVPVTATIAMTPIMLFARQYLATKWAWRKDMPWENFFDTIISNYLNEHGVMMGWFEVDEKGEPIGVQQIEPETVQEEDLGLDPKTVAFGKLMVTEMVKALTGNGHGK